MFVNITPQLQLSHVALAGWLKGATGPLRSWPQSEYAQNTARRLRDAGVSEVVVNAVIGMTAGGTVRLGTVRDGLVVEDGSDERH